MHVNDFLPRAQTAGGPPGEARQRQRQFFAAVNRDSAALLAKHRAVSQQVAESRYTRQRDSHLAVLAEVERELRVIRKFGLIQCLDSIIR